MEVGPSPNPQGHPTEVATRRKHIESQLSISFCERMLWISGLSLVKVGKSVPGLLCLCVVETSVSNFVHGYGVDCV